MKWYHGSYKDFDQFKLKKGTYRDLNYMNPIFLTSEYKFANYYSRCKNGIIYTVEVLTNKIFDPSKLPSDSNLYYYETGKLKNSNLDYKNYDYDLALKLKNDIDSSSEFDDMDTSNFYNNLVTGDYSYLEDTWFFDWLKKNNYDGCYVWETGTKNLFVFDPNKLKILNKEIPKNEKLVTKFNIYNMKYLKTFETYRETLSTDMLNDILDKISEFGIKSLSDHEKKLLKSYSDKNIDVEEEIRIHQNKFLTAKSVVRDLVPLAVDGHELEKDIGRFIQFKVKDDTIETRKKMGYQKWLGFIFEIVGVQKHWGHDEKGNYVPNRIGYRVAEVGNDDDFGAVCGTNEAIFLDITEDEALKINKKIWEEYRKENFKRIDYNKILKEI